MPRGLVDNLREKYREARGAFATEGYTMYYDQISQLAGKTFKTEIDCCRLYSFSRMLCFLQQQRYDCTFFSFMIRYSTALHERKEKAYYYSIVEHNVPSLHTVCRGFIPSHRDRMPIRSYKKGVVCGTNPRHKKHSLRISVLDARNPTPSPPKATIAVGLTAYDVTVELIPNSWLWANG